MIVNPLYVHDEASEGTARIFDQLILQAIQACGTNTYYIARDMQNADSLYGASDTDTYSRSWLIEMYMENVLGFEGDREFLSKFAGLEIRDQITMVISKTRFELEIADDLNATRPREGDLIYIPQIDRCFQIKYVNRWQMMLPLGTTYTWQMTCELFEYSNEVFQTGIPGIDQLQKSFSFNFLDYALKDTDGSWLMTEKSDFILDTDYNLEKIDPLADNQNVEEEEEAKQYIDWDETRPFGEPTSDDSGSHEI